MIKGKLKNMISIRGDSLYCPLSLSVDSYSNCDTNCHHCYLRRLNHVWDQDNRPMDLDLFHKQLENGLKNPNPRTPLAWALKQKKVIRFGNKADPWQDREIKLKISFDALVILNSLSWPTVIQTRFPHNLMDCYLLLESMKSHLWILIEMSPGLYRDWEIFERKIPTSPIERLSIAKELIKEGFKVGFNGEPYVPGFHTVEIFEDTIKLLKSYGIKSYNTYNLHFNDFVAKRLNAIGIDIERIWYYNKDEQWRPVQLKLIEIAKKYDIILGCPDFVNSGSYPQSNTCCGLNVSNPLTFNVHTWKNILLWAEDFDQDNLMFHGTKDYKKAILDSTWDHAGNFEEGRKAMFEKSPDRFGVEDIKW